MKNSIFLFLLFLGAACHAQNYACGLPGVAASAACFVTTTGTIALPNPIPAWGANSTTAAGGNPYLMQLVGNLTGSGTSRTPTDFNRPMILCTDSTFWGGILLGFEDNGDANLFAADDSLLIIKANGGTRYLAYIDPSGNCSPVTGVTYANDVIFDHTNNRTVYSLQGTNQTQLYQDTLSITGCPSACVGSVSVHTLLYDFANSQCIQNSYNGNSTWSLSGGSTGLFAGSADDTTFSQYYSDTGIGGQKGRWGVSWRKSYGLSSPCDIWDANSGKYQSQNGTQGTVTVVNTPGDLFYIHEVYQTPNPAWLIVTAGSNQMISGTYIGGYWGWQIGTSNVVKCGSSGIGCGGHIGNGYLDSIVGKSGTMHSYASPATPATNTTPGGAPCSDSHFSWNHNTTTDTYPVMVTAQDFQAPYNLSTLQSAPPCAYYNEIYFGNTGIGAVARVAHSFNSGWSWEFDAADGAVGQESNSGKWAAVLTDGWGQFGSTSGNPHCNIGGPDWIKSDSTDYVTGTGYGSFIMPNTGNAGHYVYHVKACSGTCTTATVHPVWPQTTTVGTTVVDNTITWETTADSQTASVSAVSNCRPNIMLVKLFDLGANGIPTAPAIPMLALLDVANLEWDFNNTYFGY